MIDEAAFQQIKKAFDAADAERERVIKESRVILKLSKQAIYAVHRDDVTGAAKLLAEARQLKERLEGDDCHKTGGFCAALEEYAEAAALHAFVTEQRVPSPEQIGVPGEHYLGGMADLTGELMRRAVNAATNGKVDEVQRIRDVVDALYGQFVQFDFRNGDLRRKYDSIKYNLQKIEQVLYDLKVKR